MPLNFETTPADRQSITEIAARACKLAAKYGVLYSRLDCIMDLSLGHNAIALDLPALLAAGDGDFAHDVFGIRRHLNRQTGQIEQAFLPRYAAPAA